MRAQNEMPEDTEVELDEDMMHPGLLGHVPEREKTPGELIQEKLKADDTDGLLLSVVAEQKRHEQGLVETNPDYPLCLQELDSISRFLEKKRDVRDMERRVAQLKKRQRQLQAQYPDIAARLKPMLEQTKTKRSMYMRKSVLMEPSQMGIQLEAGVSGWAPQPKFRAEMEGQAEVYSAVGLAAAGAPAGSQTVLAKAPASAKDSPGRDTVSI